MKRREKEASSEASIPFASELLRSCASKDDRNVILSPFSVATALVLALAGAQGDTAAQTKKILELADLSQEAVHHDFAALVSALNQVQGVEIAVANALWVDRDLPLNLEFVERAHELQADARNLDFQGSPEESRLTINAWVEHKTKGKINDLLPNASVKPNTGLVITNAVYFKGLWAHPFKKEHTHDSDFHLLDNSGRVRPKMMHQASLETLHALFDDHAMVLLPYKGGEVVMLVLLPHENSASALRAITGRGCMQMVHRNLSSMRKANVNLKLPRFKFAFDVRLSPVLKEMGMSIPFTEQADFRPMVAPDSYRGPLQIDEVVHKAFVEVNEEGTEAAAATAVVMATNCRKMPVPEVRFVADRPFAFVLYHTSLQCVLFVGRVVDPTAA